MLSKGNSIFYWHIDNQKAPGLVNTSKVVSDRKYKNYSSLKTTNKRQFKLAQMFAIELDLYWVALFGLHSWLSPIALAHQYNCYYSFRFTGAHRFLHPIHPLQTEDVIARSLTYIAAARVHRICGSVCDLCARARHSINSACAIAAIGISALHTVYYMNVVVVCVCSSCVWCSFECFAHIV